MSMDVVTVSMPPTLRERLDAFAEAHDFEGRSAVVREGTRGLLNEFENTLEDDQVLSGIVAVQFTSHSKRAEQRLSEVRHSHGGRIVGHTHQCMNPDTCLEVYILSGTVEDISAFVQKLRAISQLDHVEYSLLPIDEAQSQVGLKAVHD